MERVKVLVADDHGLLRRGVVEMLSDEEGLEVVGQATNGVEAVEKVRALLPNVVIMDLQMPGMGGLEATSVIRTELPSVQVLVFTVSESEADLFAAIRYGARGYILKNSGSEELVRAVRHIAEGGVIVSPAMATKLLTDLTHQPHVVEGQTETRIEGVSPREMEVLQLIARGATNSEIATTLVITENTVKTHLRNIMDKLHLANRSQAAAYAVSVGIHRPPER
ncbi:MAG: response regulator transcription factor [Chloroflexi bacterium]|nr:response regulator transcription factor [Chloroflexota bacterium]